MEEGGTKLMPVVAVIDDYYPSHLTEGIKPMAFVVGPSSGNSDFLIAVNPDKEKEVIEYLKKFFSNMAFMFRRTWKYAKSKYRICY